MERKNLDNDELVEEGGFDILTRASALIIGSGLFIMDKRLHEIDPLPMEWYGALAMIALGFTPDFGSMFKINTKKKR